MSSIERWLSQQDENKQRNPGVPDFSLNSSGQTQTAEDLEQTPSTGIPNIDDGLIKAQCEVMKDEWWNITTKDAKTFHMSHFQYAVDDVKFELSGKSPDDPGFQKDLYAKLQQAFKWKPGPGSNAPKKKIKDTVIEMINAFNASQS